MKPTAEQAAVAEAELARLVDRFPLGYVPRLEWRPFRTTAGMAYYRRFAIGLSARVLTTPEAIRETLGHEYAHLLAVRRHGLRAANHGPAWQTAMRELGLEPTVRHQYDVARNTSRQTVIYECGRCGLQFARRRRLPNRARYLHVGCGGELRLRQVQSSPPDA